MKELNNEEIKKGLESLFPNPICELNYTHDHELLLSVMLSAQTTDKRVNEVTKPIYEQYDTLEKLNKLSEEEIEEKIMKIGFHHTKSKNFKKIVETLIKLGGKVPKDRDVLENMPGVGRKTASVVLSNLYDVPSVAVDTHVFRVSKRLGITTEEDDIIETEAKLKTYFNEKDWNKINSMLVLFGRYICISRKPKCEECPFNNKCKVTSKN